MHDTNSYDLHPKVIQELGAIGFLKSSVQFDQLRNAFADDNDQTHAAIAEVLGEKLTQELEPEALKLVFDSFVDEINEELQANVPAPLCRHIKARLPSDMQSDFSSSGVFEQNIWRRDFKTSLIDMLQLNSELSMNLKMVVSTHIGFYEITTRGKVLTYRKTSESYFEMNSKSKCPSRHQLPSQTSGDVLAVIEQLDFSRASNEYANMQEIINRYHEKVFQ
ncbi:hypothetical protein VCHA53O466_50167 [Vibrio chagasii]|nr:hypothetical protein VCHA53O466_50167 [Vibrio chagasii]